MQNKTIDLLSPYYKEAFKNHQLGSTFIKWNWGPFFFSYFWLFYKRMYLSGLAVITILIISSKLPSFLLLLVAILIRIILSLYGTSLYGKKLEKTWNGVNPPQNNIGIIITIIAVFFVIIVSAFSICFLWEDLDCCGGCGE